MISTVIEQIVNNSCSCSPSSGDTFYHLTFHRDFRVNIEHTGRVTWAFGGIFTTTCNIDMTYYPLDLQKCDLVFENWQVHFHIASSIILVKVQDGLAHVLLIGLFIQINETQRQNYLLQDYYLFQYHSGAVKLLTNGTDGMTISGNDFSENGVWRLDHVSSSAEEYIDNGVPDFKFPRVSSVIIF